MAEVVYPVGEAREDGADAPRAASLGLGALVLFVINLIIVVSRGTLVYTHTTNGSASKGIFIRPQRSEGVHALLKNDSQSSALMGSLASPYLSLASN
jgi:hypothetical protein